MQINDEHERLTIETYDRNAQLWAQDHSMEDSQHLLETFRRLVPTGSVLEIGAGGGFEGNLLHSMGYDYLGTDVAPAMVKLASEKYSNLQFEVKSVYHLSEFTRMFDAVWANAVLLHIPLHKVPEVLNQIAHVLKTNGIVFIGLKEGSGQEFEVRDVAGRKEERIFSYWSKDDFTELLEQHGFSVVLYEYAPKSERSKWHRFYAQKIS